METLPTHDPLSAQETAPPAPVPAPPAAYDSPWKEAIEQYLAAFLAFFFPVVHAGIA